MGFLADLADMARGVTPAGAARVSLPPRFAEAGATAAEPFAETREESRPAPATRQPSIDTPGKRETTSSRSWGPEEGRDGPAVAIASRPIPPPPEPLAAYDAARPTETARPAPGATPLDGGRGPRPTVALARPDAMAAPLSRPRRSAAGTPAAAIQPAEAGGHPAPAAALARLEDAAPAAVLSPLSDAAVASRPRAPRDERPVIHVTIDRLEVRAPATPKAAVERRKSRPLPSQSLADYLRGGAGGGRR